MQPLRGPQARRPSLALSEHRQQRIGRLIRYRHGNAPDSQHSRIFAGSVAKVQPAGGGGMLCGRRGCTCPERSVPLGAAGRLASQTEIAKIEIGRSVRRVLTSDVDLRRSSLSAVTRLYLNTRSHRCAPRARAVACLGAPGPKHRRSRRNVGASWMNHATDFRVPTARAY